MTKIVVGVEDSERSKDAWPWPAASRATARAEIILANAYRYDPTSSQFAAPELRHHLHAMAREALRRARAGLARVEPQERMLPGLSAPGELQTLAEREDAAARDRLEPPRRRRASVRRHDGRTAPARIAVPGRRGPQGLR